MSLTAVSQKRPFYQKTDQNCIESEHPLPKDHFFSLENEQKEPIAKIETQREKILGKQEENYNDLIKEIEKVIQGNNIKCFKLMVVDDNFQHIPIARLKDIFESVLQDKKWLFVEIFIICDRFNEILQMVLNEIDEDERQGLFDEYFANCPVSTLLALLGLLKKGNDFTDFIKVVVNSKRFRSVFGKFLKFIKKNQGLCDRYLEKVPTYDLSLDREYFLILDMFCNGNYPLELFSRFLIFSNKKNSELVNWWVLTQSTKILEQFSSYAIVKNYAKVIQVFLKYGNLDALKQIFVLVLRQEKDDFVNAFINSDQFYNIFEGFLDFVKDSELIKILLNKYLKQGYINTLSNCFISSITKEHWVVVIGFIKSSLFEDIFKINLEDIFPDRLLKLLENCFSFIPKSSLSEIFWYAVKKNNKEIIRVFLDKGESDFLKFPFMTLIKRGRWEIANMFIEHEKFETIFEKFLNFIVDHKKIKELLLNLLDNCHKNLSDNLLQQALNFFHEHDEDIYEEISQILKKHDYIVIVEYE